MKDKIPSLAIGLLLPLLYGCQEPPPSSVQVPQPPSVQVPQPKQGFVVELSDNDFREKIREGVVLLDAYAVWCGPCQWMEPHLEKVAETLHGKVLVARIDADANQEFAELFRVNAFPTLFVLIDGKTTETVLGYHTEEQLLKLVEKYVDATEPVVLPSQEEQ